MYIEVITKISNHHVNGTCHQRIQPLPAKVDNELFEGVKGAKCMIAYGCYENHGFVPNITHYLCFSNQLWYIEGYVQKVNPHNIPLVVKHSDDILGARMLWKPKETRILKNFIDQPV
jgi:hypothetical protein